MNDLMIWNECVAAAKNKIQKNSCGYQIIRGSVLKEAQRAYCVIMIATK